MAGIKIVDLPAVGRDLAATDLFEMSLAGGTGSRKITGQEIMNASKLSVNNTPVINGTAGRIFFQGSTNVLQQSANLFWDNPTNRFIISGPILAGQNGFCSLSNGASSYGAVGSNYYYDFGTNTARRWGADHVAQIDFGFGFKFRVAGNGSSGSTISFSDLGYWNSITGNLLVGTTTDAGFRLDVNGTARFTGQTTYANNMNFGGNSDVISPSSNSGNFDFLSNLPIRFLLKSGSVERMRIVSSTGNVLIGTATDDGFRLDVNGTARVQDLLDVAGTNGRLIFRAPELSTRLNGVHWTNPTNTGSYGYIALSSGTGEMRMFTSATYFPTFYSSGSERMRIPTTGNVLINTTTDAGFRLDVNGDTIFRRVTNVTPNTITGGTQFFTVKSGNWPTALIRCFENGVINLGSSSGSIGFDTSIFNLPVSSTFIFNYVPANQLNTFAFILSANYTNVGAGGTSEGTMLRTSGSTSTSVGAVTMNQIESKPTYNNTGGTTINRGFYYNPILTSMTNTTHYAIHSTSGRVRLEGLPTSPTGLSAGDLWNNGGVINIV